MVGVSEINELDLELKHIRRKVWGDYISSFLGIPQHEKLVQCPFDTLYPLLRVLRGER
jgi:hypothetical protein